MEQWKSLKTLTETVDASLPDPVNHTVHHRRASGEFRVFAPYHRGGRPYLGSATLPLGPDEWKPDEARWASALEAARSVPDPWYPLDLPSTALPESRTSTMEKQELERWIEPMAEVIQKSLNGESALAVREHLRFERHLVQYRDSLGNELDAVRHSAWLEVLLVPRDAPESHPFTAELRFSEFAPEVITGFLRDQARLTVAAHRATAWEPVGDFQVLLRGAALASVFDFLLVHLGGPARASGVSQLSVGQTLWSVPKEPLTITALADLYNSPEPGGFDDEGVVLQPRTLVKDGKVRAFWTTQATAHWLGLPLTGRPRNFSVSPGSATWASLSGQRVLEVHRLRWAQVDPATGEFAVEVGLADWHEEGRRRPVFGFSAQGNLRDVLTNALFSSEVASWEHLEGPEFLVVPSSVFRRS